MTLSFRNGLLTFLLAVTAVLAGFFLYTAFSAQQHFGWDTLLPVTEDHRLWFFSWSAGEVHLYNVILEIGLLLPIVLGGLLYLRQVFRKTTAAELFFFAVFLASLGGETLRIIQIFFLLQDQPFFEGVFLTRIIWTFRFFGLFSLFLASMYAQGLNYQKYGNLVGLSLVISLVISFNLPIQTMGVQSDLLFPLGDERGTAILFLTFTVMTLLNFWLCIHMKKRENAAFLLLASLLYYFGWQATLFGFYLASLLLVPGTILLGRKTQEYYLWLG